MRPSITRTTVALTCAGLVSLLPAVAAAASKGGVSTQDASQIMASVQKAEEATSGVHLTGKISEPSTKVTFSLNVTGSGNGTGTFTESGQTVRVEKVGSKVFVYGSTKFWRQNGAGSKASKLGSRWVEAPATNTDFSGLAQYLSLTRLTTELFPSGSTPFKQTTTARIGGKKVVAVVGRATESGGTAESTTLYVAATGKPYVLLAVATAGDEKGTISFTRYGEKTSVKTPPRPLSLSSLTG